MLLNAQILEIIAATWELTYDLVVRTILGIVCTTKS